MRAGNKGQQIKDLGQIASKGADVLSVGLILLLVSIVFWGILVRYLPFVHGMLRLWTEDGGIASLIWLTFIVGAFMVAKRTQFGGHYVVRLLYNILPPRIQLPLAIFVEALGLALFVVMAMVGVRYSISVREAVTFNVGWPFMINTIPLALGSTLIVAFIINNFISSIHDRFRQ